MSLDTLRIGAEILIHFNNLKMSVIDNNAQQEINKKISDCFRTLIYELLKYGINDVVINEAFDYWRDRYRTLKQKFDYWESLKNTLKNKYEMYDENIRSVVIVKTNEIKYLLNMMNELNDKLFYNQKMFIEKLSALDPYSMFNFLSCRFTCVNTGFFLNNIIDLEEFTIAKVLGPKELGVMRYEFIIKNNDIHQFKIVVGFSLNSLTGDVSRFFI